MGADSKKKGGGGGGGDGGINTLRLILTGVLAITGAYLNSKTYFTFADPEVVSGGISAIVKRYFHTAPPYHHIMTTMLID